jgi:hypothetical protein
MQRSRFLVVLAAFGSAFLITSCGEQPTTPLVPPDSSLEALVQPPPVPTQWRTVIDNEFLPLTPGTFFIYLGEKDGEPELNPVHVTRHTKTIMGVVCVAVEDTSYVSGRLKEATVDYYAQAQTGDVFYFGEDTKEFDDQGHVSSTEGTWQAGVDGAQPGIIMEAHPKVGDHYLQEFESGVAEDLAKVVGLHETVDVPYGHFTDCLKTKEWSRLENGVSENKYYARGIGFLRDVTIQGGSDHSELVSIGQE